MIGEPLVSVIIPSFNRANLLGETLESIINQDYKKWECIIVDDGSNDGTQEMLKVFLENEERINYFHRPDNLPRGANVCRNYGFENSKGDYIIWFDSDDLMTPDHIENKVLAIQQANVDFVVAQTANFQDGRLLEPYRYEKKDYGIRATDFILLKIHWYTYDVLLKREIAQKISWNEKMKSWQDYNYFCKMLLLTEKGIYIEEVLTHRRLHSNSIQQAMTQNSKSFQNQLLENRILTFQDIKEQINWATKKELLFGMMNLCFDLAKTGILTVKFSKVSKMVLENFGRNSMLFFGGAVFFSLFFKRGHFLLEKSKKRSK